MCFFIKDDDLLEKYNSIGDKFSADKEIEFDSKPICYKNFLKTKIMLHVDEGC